ncbi:Uncharacterized protein dnl_57500 [Desulfonema limicola]|uniref:Prevent-host-death family protein n=1 Tax=Desulfonema limicola TaxID=45656 RepID=A0A975BDZ8_9BACT|nr:hypothetical protein [Desulfonema limicola]QTA83350.1 Uncharacterized protein dnl_57500 [Desulfonema limicola]
MINLNKLNIQYVTDYKGNRTSVLLPISEFEELLADIEDLAIAAERRDEPVISHKQLLAELKQDGH